MEVSKRRKNIKEFQENLSKPTVMVATMKVGNVGVNLTAATRVYLFENSQSTARTQAAGESIGWGRQNLAWLRNCYIVRALNRQ